MTPRIPRRSPPCPECHTKRTSEIQYGYPGDDPEMLAEIKQGIIVLGGCCVTPDNPAYVCRRCGYEWHDESPPVTSFPLYILFLGKRLVILRPADRRNIPFEDFWYEKAASEVAYHFELDTTKIYDLAFCQRRARVEGNTVYYGERSSPRIFQAIRTALGKSDLVFVQDDALKCSPKQVREFELILTDPRKGEDDEDEDEVRSDELAVDD